MAEKVVPSICGWVLSGYYLQRGKKRLQSRGTRGLCCKIQQKFTGRYCKMVTGSCGQWEGVEAKLFAWVLMVTENKATGNWNNLKSIT